ncbi:hypothetical protein CFK38_04690 [Brachybacterium vulturis]|uniref:Uncharacterized protein n=1 Tax=Brachybacterium vulturis TaxID=2017484 RepID=A0A291GK53_9MICO|nr:hypothetical protein [Brachybacterium vulturis]ATG50903.1 hypothetical protein CFK38_04690 [Brachybacterium vulturis]
MSLIWATRGRSWGFRFLRSGGTTDPLFAYEEAFSGIEDEPQVYRRVGGRVALRFPDPEERKDAAGRLIPHEFVLDGEIADGVRSLDEGRAVIWPLISEEYARIWDGSSPPPVCG